MAKASIAIFIDLPVTNEYFCRIFYDYVTVTYNGTYCFISRDYHIKYDLEDIHKDITKKYNNQLNES
jgi:hypothetical protein